MTHCDLHAVAVLTSLHHDYVREDEGKLLSYTSPWLHRAFCLQVVITCMGHSYHPFSVERKLLTWRLEFISAGCFLPNCAGTNVIMNGHTFSHLCSCSKNVIIHRDLKPANLMIAGVPFEGGSREIAQKQGFVKIADFGLSRSLAINNPHSKTAPAKQVEEDRHGSYSDTLHSTCLIDFQIPSCYPNQ